MSLTLNMVGGGSGGLKATDALLRVQAPAGSTVTITKDTTTKTDLGHENANDHTLYDYYFIIHQSQFDSVNPWTVTATLGVDEQSGTIIIDTADEYNMVIIYRLPPAYQEVEYIERASNQEAWFDTGYQGTRTSNIKIIFTKLNYAGEYPWVFGAFKSSSAFMGVQIQGAGGKVYAYNANGQVTGLSLSDNTKASVKFTDGNKISYSTNGGASYTDYSITSTNDPAYTFALFAIKNSASSISSGSATNLGLRIHSFVVDDREFIPCYRKSDSVIGFWDDVGKVFITKNGSGTVTVGGDIN